MTIDTTRRRLLQGGVAVAGLALGTRVSGIDITSPGRKLGIAVVGIGNFANYAIPRIQASRFARLAGLVSGDRAKAERYARDNGVDFRHIYHYDNFERIADDPAIDLVYLTLPVGLHCEYAIRAMRAGKHVLTEKTLAATLEQGREMLAVAETTGRHLMIAYRAYFGPAYQTVHRLIRENNYGRVVHIDAHKGFPITLPANNWRFDPKLGGGGSLFDVGVYSVQATRLFAGEMPTQVTAQTFSPQDSRFASAEDSVVFTLRFPNGVLASGSSSWSYRLQNRLRVGLESAWLDLEPASPAVGQVLRIAQSNGHQGEEYSLAQQEQLPLMFDHVADVVLNGARTIIPASEGLLDMEIIAAIYKAAASGRAALI